DGGGVLTTNSNTVNLSGIFANVAVQITNASGTTFTVDNVTTALHIVSGPGADTLDASALTLTADQRNSIFLSSSVETIKDATGIYSAPLTLTTGDDVIATTQLQNTVLATS